MTWDLFWHHTELWTPKHTEDFWRAWEMMLLIILIVWILLFENR